MRIAFYAPLKPPDHPIASGDRTVARMLLAALKLGGHDVGLASRFRSYDSGDRDGLPNAIMEAATQALPIVSTRFSGVPEFVRHDVEGLLVEPGDVDALAGALDALIRSPDARRRHGEAAHARVRSAFSFEAGIAALLDRLAAATRLAA